jgi:alpha-glucosidase
VSASGAPTIGYPNRNLLAPPYQIDNQNTVEAYGGLSNFTLDTDIVHYDGHVELDVHNIYGSMMSTNSRLAMESRRPGRRPLIVTRSTFAGDGKRVAKWLGDNLSTWEQYRQSIQGMLDFASFFQMPMVGSDVCGFGGNTTETLCARWAMLGAFYPFMRNHNGDTSIPQEFFLWENVTTPAKKALDIRYRLLDYIYTAMYKQNQTGTPVLSPLFYKYPNDSNTFGVELQFFYGDYLLVSPVTEENSTSVDIYVPEDLFYDFATYLPVEGTGANVTLENVGFDQIPLHIKGGAILPMRNESAMTTKALREQPFHLLIAPDAEGNASGELYLDDGDSIEQESVSVISFSWSNNTLTVDGTFDYESSGDESRALARVSVLGVESEPASARLQQGESSSNGQFSYTAESQSVEIHFAKGVEMDKSFTLSI